jgi:hypothetical protein
MKENVRNVIVELLAAGRLTHDTPFKLVMYRITPLLDDWAESMSEKQLKRLCSDAFTEVTSEQQKNETEARAAVGRSQ